MKSEFLLYWIIKLGAWIVRCLPISAAIWLGRLIGRMAYIFDVKHKKTAYLNLKIAFAGQKKAREINKILKELFCNYGQFFIELFRLPCSDSIRHLRVEGKEHVDAALQKGKGVILVAMHSGSWELTHYLGQLLGSPYHTVVNPQDRNTRLDSLLQSYRKKTGAHIISTSDFAARNFVKALRSNEIVGIVTDQGGREGKLVEFFGHPASMSVGAIRIALKWDIPICFGILIHDKGPCHRVLIEPAMTMMRTGDTEKDLLLNLRQIAQRMESYITQYPSQYMWFYKIWKYSKESTVIILNDGRIGHLRQSQAVADLVKKSLAERERAMNLHVIDIKFKSRLKRSLFSGLNFVIHNKVFPEKVRYLKWFLDRKSFLELMSVKGDFVISCGSSVAGVNYLISHDDQAKSIVIQKPANIGLKNFDLVILPQHDQRTQDKRYKNVVWTKMALNLIHPLHLEDQAKRLLEKFPELKKRSRHTIGVLFGGDSKTHRITFEQAREVIRQIKTAAEFLDARILVTTSRRTSPYAQEALCEELIGYARCPLLVQEEKNNIPEAVGGILGLSDLLVVSSDSISMVSEAVSSGKKVLVFPAQRRKKKKKTKHEVFVEHLEKEGHICFSQEECLGKSLAQLAQKAYSFKPVNDQEFLFEMIKKIK